jgi:hypothetical protein
MRAYCDFEVSHEPAYAFLLNEKTTLNSVDTIREFCANIGLEPV